MERLGPDALAVEFESFFAKLRSCRGSVKAMLLNQRYISGVGNIYADEILFASKIHPRAKAFRLSKPRAQKLFEALKTVLNTAIEHRGSSISDYVDAAGNAGAFQNLHRVYAKAGEPCINCGSAIRRILIAQRSTHYCLRCQRV
jgi:formamidopyrimidine-DNA glycosylase